MAMNDFKLIFTVLQIVFAPTSDLLKKIFRDVPGSRVHRRRLQTEIRAAGVVLFLIRHFFFFLLRGKSVEDRFHNHISRAISSPITFVCYAFPATKKYAFQHERGGPCAPPSLKTICFSHRLRSGRRFPEIRFITRPKRNCV